MKKPINKKESKQKVSAEDEWAHLSEEEVGGPNKKIEAADAMDVQDRNITFGGDHGPKSAWDEFRSKTSDTAKTADSTAKYVKFVNSHLEQQRSHIDKLRELKERFDDEIANLQSTTANLHSIPSVPAMSGESMNEAYQMLDQLVKDKEAKVAQIDTLRGQIAQIETDLMEKEKKIVTVQKQLGTKKSATIESAKNELESLIEKYGVSKLSETLNHFKLGE